MCSNLIIIIFIRKTSLHANIHNIFCTNRYQCCSNVVRMMRKISEWIFPTHFLNDDFMSSSSQGTGLWWNLMKLVLGLESKQRKFLVIDGVQHQEIIISNIFQLFVLKEVATTTNRAKEKLSLAQLWIVHLFDTTNRENMCGEWQEEANKTGDEERQRKRRHKKSSKSICCWFFAILDYSTLFRLCTHRICFSNKNLTSDESRVCTCCGWPGMWIWFFGSFFSASAWSTRIEEKFQNK